MTIAGGPVQPGFLIEHDIRAVQSSGTVLTIPVGTTGDPDPHGLVIAR